MDMFNSDSVPAFVNQSVTKDELSMDDIQNLLNNHNQSDSIQIQKYKENDVVELEEFCKAHGIVGFNFGNMSPTAALQILKRKIGYVDPNQNEGSISNKQLLCG